MVESVLFFIVVAVASYGIYLRGRAKRAASIVRPGDLLDYTMTIWAERTTPVANAVGDPIHPQRISVDYAVSLVFSEEEEMSVARKAIAQSASEDFHRRFVPILGQTNIGAICFEPTHRDA